MKRSMHVKMIVCSFGVKDQMKNNVIYLVLHDGLLLENQIIKLVGLRNQCRAYVNFA